MCKPRRIYLLSEEKDWQEYKIKREKYLAEKGNPMLANPPTKHTEGGNCLHCVLEKLLEQLHKEHSYVTRKEWRASRNIEGEHSCEQCGTNKNVYDFWWCEMFDEKWKLCEQCGIDEEQERCAVQERTREHIQK